MPAHSYIIEEGKKKTKKNPQYCLREKNHTNTLSLEDELDSSGGRLDPAPLNGWLHQFKYFKQMIICGDSQLCSVLQC